MGNQVTSYGTIQPAIISDPGDDGAIPPRSGWCAIVSVAAEDRTLAIPTRLNEELGLFFKTDGGTVTITVATAINVNGNNTITFADANESIVLRSVWTGAAFAWRVAWNDINGADSDGTSDIGKGLSTV